MGYDQAKQKVWSARWLAKLKADPDRYEAYLERSRARDRDRPSRKAKPVKLRAAPIGQRLTASKLTHTAKHYPAKRPRENRPETERNLKEIYRLGRAGQKVHGDRLEKLREREERRAAIDEAVARLTGQASNHGLPHLVAAFDAARSSSSTPST